MHALCVDGKPAVDYEFVLDKVEKEYQFGPRPLAFLLNLLNEQRQKLCTAPVLPDGLQAILADVPVPGATGRFATRTKAAAAGNASENVQIAAEAGVESCVVFK